MSEQSMRLGQWMDWGDSYFTMSDENNYTIWRVIKTCHERGWLYRGHDVMPWCPRCGTGISTGVNKSGLYSEFKDKGDLFMQSLRYYLESLEKKGLLTAEPLGWNNIERFLKLGPCSMEGQKGCFAVSSMREFAILPPEAVGIITRSRSKLKQLIAKNIEVERPKMNADSLAELVLTFFSGLSMEHNLSSSRPSIVRKIDDLMNIVRTL